MLTILKTPRVIRDFLVYDLEWIPGTLKVRLVGVHDGNRYRCYRSVQEFIACELTSKNRGKWFYAHAGGLADIQFIFEHFVEVNRRDPRYVVKAHFSGSSAIIVKVTVGKNVWYFVDSYWLLRDKLANIGKWLNLEKGGLAEPEDGAELDDDAFEEFKKEKRRWFAEVPYLELREYNERDCLILWRAISEFQDTLMQLGGQLQMTLASSAMQLFRRSYLKRSIDVPPYPNLCARKAYFASRVEVFQREVKSANYYDINSSFPHAMTFPVPGNYLGSSDTIPDSGIYIADVDIQVEADLLTPTPTRINSRVFFPFGKWRSWLTSVDIELLQRKGGKILKVHEVLKFDEFNDLSAYMLEIYGMRKNSDNEFRRICLKLLMNCLYGKFAETPFKSSLEINPKEIDRSEMTMLFPGAWLRETEVDVPHLLVPISAHVTARARMTLFDFMDRCKDYHYCDTDGFSTTSELETGKELGSLKLEKKISEGIFMAPKLYRIVGKIEKKGEWVDSTYVKGKGFSRLTSKRFFKLLEGEAIDFERMSRVKERFRKGVASPQENPFEKRINLRSIYDPEFDPDKHSVTKRFFYPDGHTRPWAIDEVRELVGKKGV